MRPWPLTAKWSFLPKGDIGSWKGLDLPVRITEGMEARQGESPAISRAFSEADSPVPGGETPNLASFRFASCWFDHKHEELRKHGGEREGARTQRCAA